jgi:hypothetical protein
MDVENVLSKLPFMNPKMRNRLNIVFESNHLNQFSFELAAVENFPMRGYFRVELFFKLFLFFLLFGIHMKGWNIPIFISLLIVYYWYNIYTEITKFYEKQVEDIKLKQEDLKEIKHLMDPDDLSEEGLSEGEGEIKEEVKEAHTDNNLLNENKVLLEENDIKIEDINREEEQEEQHKGPTFKGKDPMENELNNLVKPYDAKKPKADESLFM